MNIKIGDKVRVIWGDTKGHVGIYKGLQNNSNWHVVDTGNSILYVNEEEFEKVEDDADR